MFFFVVVVNELWCCVDIFGDSAFFFYLRNLLSWHHFQLSRKLRYKLHQTSLLPLLPDMLFSVLIERVDLVIHAYWTDRIFNACRIRWSFPNRFWFLPIITHNFTTPRTSSFAYCLPIILPYFLCFRFAPVIAIFYGLFSDSNLVFPNASSFVLSPSAISSTSTTPYWPSL